MIALKAHALELYRDALNRSRQNIDRQLVYFVRFMNLLRQSVCRRAQGANQTSI